MSVLRCSGGRWYIHIIIIVTWSGVLYHIKWMRSYHRITWDTKRRGWSNGMISSTKVILYARSNYNNIFIIYLFLTLFRFYKLFWSFIDKNCGNVCLYVTSLHVAWHQVIMFSVSGSMLEIYLTSPHKQVSDVSLVLKDSDTESENLSLLICLSVSGGQKTDSSKVVSFIGI